MRPCAAQTRYFPIFENYKNESINMFLAGYPADKARYTHMPITRRMIVLPSKALGMPLHQGFFRSSFSRRCLPKEMLSCDR